MARSGWNFLFAAWMVALAATLGALFIGEIMGQMPCTTCWYQRIFMFPLVVVLGIAAYRKDLAVWVYALPLVLIGLFVAIYHTLLYAGVIPEPIELCGAGPSCSGDTMLLFGALPIPFLSLIAFSMIAILLVLVARSPSK